MESQQVVEINVGGIAYTTTKAVLVKEKGSLLHEWFESSGNNRLPRDANNRCFIDRDGELFRYILDALRNGSAKLATPDNFNDHARLRAELEYYRLHRMLPLLTPRKRNAVSSSSTNDTGAGAVSSTTGGGFITVGYHGTFSFGRQGISADINFRKIMRILICGRVSLCREVFGEAINEGRDPDRGEGEDRYTARFFLKHSFLEQAFDKLSAAGFRMVGCCGTGTNGFPSDMFAGGGAQSAKHQPNTASEEDRWAHYNEFIFCRV